MERHAPEPTAEPTDTSTATTAESVQAQPTEQTNADGTPRKLTKGQERFRQLEHERDTHKKQAESAQQRAERAERERDEVKRNFEALRTQPKATVQTESTVATRERPSEDQVGSKYPTYADFVEDLADWKAEQRETKLRQDIASTVSERIEADRARQSLTSHATDIKARGREAYQDFDAVLTASDVMFSPGHQQAILMMPGSEHVQYALGKDRALAERISQVNDPFMLGLELAKLIPSGRAVSPASTRPTAIPKAPVPYQPVGSGSKTTSPPLEDLAADGNYDAYKARRSADLKLAARR